MSSFREVVQFAVTERFARALQSLDSDQADHEPLFVSPRALKEMLAARAITSGTAWKTTGTSNAFGGTSPYTVKPPQERRMSANDAIDAGVGVGGGVGVGEGGGGGASGAAVRRLANHVRRSLRHARTASDSFVQELNCCQRVPLLNPNHPVMLCWSVLIVLLILLSAFAVPVQSAFYDELDFPWLVFNSVIDGCFALDILVNFNLPTRDSVTGDILVNRGAISRQYLKGYFWIDLISTVPVALVVTLVAKAQSPVLRNLRLLRAVRLTRLVKLLRLTRLGDILNKVVDMMEITDATAALSRNFFVVVLLCHLMACLLFVVSRVEGANGNWEDAYFGVPGAVPISTRYTVGLYWAAMTCTTIGYGDVSMQTPAEQLYATGCMLIGASLFAIVMGNAVGAALELRESRGETAIFMTAKLRQLAAIVHLPPALHDALTSYSRQLAADVDFPWIFRKLSPALRATLAHRVWSYWTPTISCLSPETNRVFLVGLLLSMDSSTFCPQELIFGTADASECMFIVKHGRVLVDMIPVRETEAFGEEMILRNGYPAVRRAHFAVAGFRYVHTHVIWRDRFFKLASQFPQVLSKVRIAAAKIAFRRRGCFILRKLAQSDDREVAAEERDYTNALETHGALLPGLRVGRPADMSADDLTAQDRTTATMAAALSTLNGTVESMRQELQGLRNRIHELGRQPSIGYSAKRRSTASHARSRGDASAGDDSGAGGNGSIYHASMPSRPTPHAPLTTAMQSQRADSQPQGATSTALVVSSQGLARTGLGGDHEEADLANMGDDGSTAMRASFETEDAPQRRRLFRGFRITSRRSTGSPCGDGSRSQLDTLDRGSGERVHVQRPKTEEERLREMEDARHAWVQMKRRQSVQRQSTEEPPSNKLETMQTPRLRAAQSSSAAAGNHHNDFGADHHHHSQQHPQRPRKHAPRNSPGLGRSVSASAATAGTVSKYQAAPPTLAAPPPRTVQPNGGASARHGMVSAAHKDENEAQDDEDARL